MKNPFTIERSDGRLFPPSAALHVPDHELVKRIGRGSYGEVWLARNVVGTRRAVKVVYRSGFDEARPFEREFIGIQRFEPISRSDEGLVDILQVGRNDAEGYFYYIMELADDLSNQDTRNAPSEGRNGLSPALGGTAGSQSVEGEAETYVPKTLGAVRTRFGRLSPRQCVDLGAALARALGCLHEYGLIHRDIKPSNIIFVQGAPKLADIGLVADLGEACSYVGTEGFIPPEGPNSPQADIYSLGKVLYEAAMGRDRNDFPEPLTGLAKIPERQLLLELNAVILKACETKPNDRYRSANDMYADLALLQTGKSVREKWAAERRLRRLAIAAATVAILTIAGLGTNRWLESRIGFLQSQSSLIQPPLVGKVPGRLASTPGNLLDLSRDYNASLIEGWYPGPAENTLQALPRGVQTLGGVPFDIRGLVQLDGQELREYTDEPFPTRLHGIPVHRWVQQLHFLQGAVAESADGRSVGRYRVHYATGKTQEIALVYGQHFRSLWQPAESPGAVSKATIAWTGRNAATQERKMVLRLYQQTWVNPTPTDEITTIDFESDMANSAPFLVAITCDEHKHAMSPRNLPEDVIPLLQKQAAVFPDLPCATNAGSAALVELPLNVHPIRVGHTSFDAVRIRTPAAGSTDLVWAFLDARTTSWAITPVSGRMKIGFEDWYHGFLENVTPNNEFAACTFQFLSGKKLQSGREYLIWFAFDDSRPATLRAALRFVPSGTVGPNNPQSLVHALAWEKLMTEVPGQMHRHYCLGAMK